jgi:hypothetical protein
MHHGSQLRVFSPPIPSLHLFADLGAFHGGIIRPFHGVGTHHFHIHGTLRQASHVYKPKYLRDISIVAPAAAILRRVFSGRGADSKGNAGC